VYKQKESKFWWYKFTWKGEPSRRSTKQTNKRVAEQMEAACETAPAKSEVGIVQREQAPTPKQFSERFIEAISVRCAEKPRTIQERRKQVAPATVNRQLATLRRDLRLAHEWKVIDRLPKIRLLQGERTRKFVLSRKQEPVYTNAAPQPLKDHALLMLDTGLRDGDALALKWRDVHAQPAPRAARVQTMLAARPEKSSSEFAFAAGIGKPCL